MKAVPEQKLCFTVPERKLCCTLPQAVCNEPHHVCKPVHEQWALSHELSFKLEVRICILVLSQGSQAVLDCIN